MLVNSDYRPANKSDKATPVLNVKLFGRFGIYTATEVVTRLTQRRAQELFSYLLLNQNRPYPRENLADRLWEDDNPAQARKSLRQALWQIKTVLQSILGSDTNKLLVLDADWVQLNRIECLSLDVDVFKDAVDASQGVQGANLSVIQRAQLEHAVKQYQGDLLEGWYQDWCLLERERLQNYYLTAVGKLLACCDAHGWIDCGLAHAERILRCDPTEEQAHYHIMHLHWTAGRRTQALRQYQRCEKILMQELGVQPSERTKMLHTLIRTEKPNPSSVSIPIPQLPADLPPLDREQLTGLMHCFQQIQGHMSNLEEQLKLNIRAVEIALKNRQ